MNLTSVGLSLPSPLSLGLVFLGTAVLILLIACLGCLLLCRRK